MVSMHRTQEPAKLAGRSELIVWLNRTLSCAIEKIEQCCNGAIYVQLMELVHPGCVPLAKVKFNAELEYEYLHNYKLLQIAFTKVGVAKHIDVERLSKGRYQDNHDFLQWMRKYVDANLTSEPVEYDGTRRRVVAVIQNCIANNGNAHMTLGTVTNALPKWAQDGVTVRLIKECLTQVKAAISQRTDGTRMASTKDKPEASDTDGKQGSAAVPGDGVKLRKISGVSSQKSKFSDTVTRASTSDSHIDSAGKETNHSSTETADTGASVKDKEQLLAERQRVLELEKLLDVSKQQNEELTQEMEKREGEVRFLKEELERQKDLVESMKKKLGQAQAEKQVSKMSKEFYYNKLRKIEVMCQKNENGSLQVPTLLEVLYATDSVTGP